MDWPDRLVRKYTCWGAEPEGKFHAPLCFTGRGDVKTACGAPLTRYDLSPSRKKWGKRRPIPDKEICGNCKRIVNRKE